MELESIKIKTSSNQVDELNSFTNRCGEIFILDNPPNISFSLICIYCDKKSNSFEDFRKHYINTHYRVQDDSIKQNCLKGTSESFNFEDKNHKFYDNSNESVIISINSFENDSEFGVNFEELDQYEVNIEPNQNNLNDSEPEIQIERYEEGFGWNSSASNSFGQDSSVELTNNIELDEEIDKKCTFENCESQSSQSNSVPVAEQILKKKSNLKSTSTLSCSLNRKTGENSKTIEIYKEEYIEKKPQFILAAVNLPDKSKDFESNESLSKFEGDPEAFPHNESLGNFGKVGEECKPKFKFNNIKFRRNQNELYYISIEKTFNEKDGLFHCPECSKCYKRIESLRYHHLSHTGVPAPFQCSICHKGFPSAYKVRIHFTKHTGERPFRCHLCPRVYRHKQQLKFHLDSHTELREQQQGVYTEITETLTQFTSNI